MATHQELEKNIFIINDLNLKIPPTNISIQKEDLVYQWKTLRSNASTKLPSGHGQIGIQVVIPFVGSQVLMMHRLVVELRNNPFCFIENRFIRESIVPDWPTGQNMAFTMTGLAIAPMNGSSDTWNVQLDLTWFNYSPYTHNFLYRKDWVTDWILSEEQRQDQLKFNLTIGWDLDEEYKKTPRKNIVGLSAFEEDKTEFPSANTIREWSVINSEYGNKMVKTIEEMEILHRGEVFDLQPIASRMSPSDYVGKPIDSRIYVRYINYLQRDALIKNFGFNIEEAMDPDIRRYYFSAEYDDQAKLITVPLHKVLTWEPYRTKSRFAIGQAVRALLSTHSGAKFSFASYKDIRMPSKFTEKVKELNKISLSNLQATHGRNISSDLGSQAYSYFFDAVDNGNVSKRFRKRPGWTFPAGKHSPIGDSKSGGPRTFAKLLTRGSGHTGKLGWRSSGTLNSIYGRSSNVGRPHWGTDFSAPFGAPVYAVAPGKVERVVSFRAGGTRWYYMDLKDGKKKLVTTTDEQSEWMYSLRQKYTWLGESDFTGTQLTSAARSKIQTGALIKSSWSTDRYFWNELSDGGQMIYLRHSDGISIYMHLSEISEEAVNRMTTGKKITEAEVNAGFMIGRVGMSAGFKEDWIKKKIPEIGNRPYLIDPMYLYGSTPEAEELSRAAFNTGGFHLHFEYWEPQNLQGSRDPEYKDQYNDGIPLVARKGLAGIDYSTMVPIDPLPSFELADPDSHVILFSRQQLLPTLESAAKKIDDDPHLSENEKGEAFDLVAGLVDEGWFYFDKDTKIRNVWWKPNSLNVQRGNAEDIRSGNSLEYFVSDDVVLTGVGGGLRHVVANIPVLGHEFPTQQHLGSVEPYFSFEFHVLDRRGLDGLSENGQLLEGMRSVLQSNARQFRPIVDGWCLLADSFITRILGTFQENDYKVSTYINTDDRNTRPLISDVEVKKRCVISRSISETVPGHPGLSMHLLEMSETNPYEIEAIGASGISMEEMEVARKEVLQALWNMDLVDRYKDLALTLFLAQSTGVSFLESQNETYGQFQIPTGYDAESNSIYMTGDKIYLQDNTGANERFLKLLNAGNGRVFEKNTDGYIEIDSGLVQKYSQPTTMVDSGQTNAGWTTGVGPVVTKARLFDISDVLLESQETMLLAEIPFDKVVNLYDILWRIHKTAELLLVEDTIGLDSGNVSGSGLEVNYIDEQLYELGVKPQLLRGYQAYMKEFAANAIRMANPAVFVERMDTVSKRQLSSNPNWLNWNVELPKDSEAWLVNNLSYLSLNKIGTYAWNTIAKLDRFTLDPLMALASDNLSAIGEFSTDFPSTALAMASTPFIGVGRLGATVVAKTAESFTNITGVEVLGIERAKDFAIQTNLLKASMEANRNDAIKLVVDGYLDLTPLGLIVLDDKLRNILDESLVGPIFGTDFAGEDKLPVFANSRAMLIESTASCGHWDAHLIHPFPTFLFKTGDTIIDPRYNRDLYLDDSMNWDLNRTNRISVGELFTDDGLPSKGTRNVGGWLDKQWPQPGSPFVWTVNKGLEENKVKYMRELMTRLADQMLNDVDVLRAFGLERLAFVNRRGELRGSPAYPDLNLPFHPYFEDLYRVSPDFYMWNIYEDGGAMREEVMKDMQLTVEHVISNCYESMNRQQKGENYSNSEGIVSEPDIGGRIDTFQRYVAEGTDAGFEESKNFGAMTTPFYTSTLDYTGLDKWNKYMEDNGALTPPWWASLGNAGAYTWLTSALTNKPPSQETPPIRLALVEGPYGTGGGVEYPSRVDEATYTRLRTEVSKVTSMFGSRAGYLGQLEQPKELTERLDHTAAMRPPELAHRFDKSSLQQLAWQSANDVVSHKMSMRRAYPTFKLYFVEEDEFETRLLNFDDFHSYNGVTGFTFVSNRKDPADHAIITLQNIAGTLDGTRRDAIVDLDYYSRNPGDKEAPAESKRGKQDVTAGTTSDQPFGAVVLRPGLNVQLRVGYSNDPNDLTVLLNGRIVDLQWNKQGDTAEIMVQSFGVELIQAIKGTNYGASYQPFYTTHSLLGAMMLEPEVAHFGRWEFNQLFMAGEAKDARLDFRDYSKEGFAGRFQNSLGMTKWMLDHPILTAALAVGGTALLARIPGTGYLLKGVSRGGAVGRYLASKGVVQGTAASAVRANLLKAGAKSTGTLTRVQARKQGVKHLKQVADDLVLSVDKTTVTKAYRESLKKMAKALDQADISVDDIAVVLEKETADFARLSLKNQWMTNPLWTGSTILSDIGFTKPVWRFAGRYMGRTPAVLAGAAGIGLGLDVLEPAFDMLYNATAGRVRNYFRTAEVSIMLSPQDDNLFPPHPKDYMILGKNSLTKDLVDWTLKTGITVFTASDELGYKGVRFFRADINDKRTEPTAWKYNLMGSTIWDVFHEASLRHPGWIYGARPYGNRFRYTMFFGIPSQRYWSKPADNEFIKRSNDLYRLLEGGGGLVTIDEYRRLYGDTTLSGESITAVKTLAQYEADQILGGNAPQGITDVDFAAFFVDQDKQLSVGQSNINIDHSRLPSDIFGRPAESSTIDVFDLPPTSSTYTADEDQKDSLVNGMLSHTMGARVLGEYLKSLELRFVPFRRYHTITSDRDIVWNGIMSSENAVYNAVDVSYFQENDDATDGTPVASSLFKAHGFIPDYKVRIMPLPPYRNCKGYSMATRYAMGQLIHNMKDMYRGEIVLLGNPRIRPWDVCVMIDSYNDMVGPIEVEQVVHSFSHESGFITEIKPSAIVIGNEISSWPMIEAMKVLSLAVKNIEDTKIGLRAEDMGSLNDFNEYFLNNMAGHTGINGWRATTHAYDQLREVFGESFSPTTDLFGGEPPNLEAVDKAIGDTANMARGAYVLGAGTMAMAAGVAGAALVFRGTGNVAKAAAGGIVTAGTSIAFQSGVVTLANQMEFPSMAWLIGGPIMFLHCLRGDSMMVVPLIKDGQPIVSGMSLHDPSSIWKNFKGDLGRYADDVLDGTRDVLGLWQTYGSEAWRRLPSLEQSQGRNYDQTGNPNLTGE